MRKFYKNLSYLTAIFFTLGIIAAYYFLYIFPDRLVANSHGALSNLDIPKIKPALNELYWVMGIVLFLGLVSIIMLILGNDRREEESNVVYIEKFRDRKKDSKDKKEGSEEDEDEASHDERLQEINKILQRKLAPKEMADKVMSQICNEIEASQGAFYTAQTDTEPRTISLFSSYAFIMPESQTLTCEFGEGLAGQVAKENKSIVLDDVPDGYLTILSGLGKAKPSFLMISPVTKGDQLLGVAEISSFKKIEAHDEAFVKKALQRLAEHLNQKEEKKSSTKKND